VIIQNVGLIEDGVKSAQKFNSIAIVKDFISPKDFKVELKIGSIFTNEI
jgi:hypothetical protein